MEDKYEQHIKLCNPGYRRGNYRRMPLYYMFLMIGLIIYTIKSTIDTIRAKRAFIPILENYYSWYTFYDPDHKYFGSDVIK